MGGGHRKERFGVYMTGRTEKMSLADNDLFLITDSESDDTPKKIAASTITDALSGESGDNAVALAIALG